LIDRACAYGIEPIVENLVAEGADVNTTNSFGFTPIFEACHRGYVGIVSLLLKSQRVDLAYIPSFEKAQESPFVSSPPQSALGEAARAGFHTIVEMLVDAGANKDQQNILGWSPLHEASFYNRIDTVKLLLLSGANPCIRTKIGALPYQLAGLQVLKSMIVDIGGPDAKPDEGENIDMLTILKEMSMIADSPSDSPGERQN
jgi:ankyrin repeat protein